ncbi:MAG: aminotransferase class V-fold PLP-dependent enzyme [Anaerolineales bacterium]|nr:MAG: aminotransferase class V-fold PLP-dependent enzyme [Anaerolineales bacterium]
MLYFDNASTSYPKPAPVIEAVLHFLVEVGASPGRSGHRLSVQAGRIIYDTREALAQLLNIDDPLRIVFGHNVTEVLNLTLKGLLRPGDHVITSSMEHNSVMRPLRTLERQGVRVTVVPCSSQGLLDPGEVEVAIAPDTRLVVLNHASNVVGTLLPVREVGRIARKHDLLFLVDAAQTAGCWPVDVQTDAIDLLAFTGHKGLLGPTGTGGLYIGPRVSVDEFEPLTQGGTGSQSEFEHQPRFLPDKYESGTSNAMGLAGLGAGVRFVLETGVDEIRRHEIELTGQLLDGLSQISSVAVYGPQDAAVQTAVVSFNISGMEPSEVGLQLDEEYEIMCRPGLHCAPSAHKTIGTFARGTVRFSPGLFTTHDDVAEALRAVEKVAKSGAH